MAVSQSRPRLARRRRCRSFMSSIFCFSSWSAAGRLWTDCQVFSMSAKFMGDALQGGDEFLLQAAQPRPDIALGQAVNGGDLRVAEALEVQQDDRAVQRGEAANGRVEMLERLALTAPASPGFGRRNQ